MDNNININNNHHLDPLLDQLFAANRPADNDNLLYSNRRDELWVQARLRDADSEQIQRVIQFGIQHELQRQQQQQQQMAVAGNNNAAMDNNVNVNVNNNANGAAENNANNANNDDQMNNRQQQQGGENNNNNNNNNLEEEDDEDYGDMNDDEDMDDEEDDEDMDDEDDEDDGDSEDDDEDDEDDDDDGDDMGNNGVIEGGMAIVIDHSSSPDDIIKSKQKSTECDLVLFIECDEELENAPNHPVLSPGVAVSIGMDKNTKLSVVFDRYVEVCNKIALEKHQKGPDKCESSEAAPPPPPVVEVSDLEFTHCQILNATETAEASALMKNDRIHVRRVRTDQRQAEVEHAKIQRDADREYFMQLRHLMPTIGGAKSADVILDCRGKIVDECGRNQQILSTTVRAHSAIVRKRCPWLGEIIDRAKEAHAEMRLQQAIAAYAAEPTPDEAGSNGGDVDNRAELRSELVRRVESDVVEGRRRSDGDDDDDDSAIAVLQVQPEQKNNPAAAQIENDEDEDNSPKNGRAEPVGGPGSPIVPSKRRRSTGKSDEDMLRVTLENHSPEAVKILLEYCYTNRVPALGQEAFSQACKTKVGRNSGPVPPHSASMSSRRWPNGGFPTISFSVALAGISLAEEAHLPRLSLMCEVAASLLVTSSNVVESLAMCTTQKTLTGNNLPRLRKSAMDVILRRGRRGVVELSRMSGFRRAMKERSAVIIPTLLIGTMETVTSSVGSSSKKSIVSFANNNSNNNKPQDKIFAEIDRADREQRNLERKRRKKEQQHRGGSGSGKRKRRPRAWELLEVDVMYPNHEDEFDDEDDEEDMEEEDDFDEEDVDDDDDLDADLFEEDDDEVDDDDGGGANPNPWGMVQPPSLEE